MNVDVLTDLPLDKMIEDHFNNKPLATLATTKRAQPHDIFYLMIITNYAAGGMWKPVLIKFQDHQ